MSRPLQVSCQNAIATGPRASPHAQSETLMSLIVGRGSVTAEENPLASVLRHFRRDSPQNVGVGVASWRRPPPGFDPEQASESHDVPEVHYVMSGSGVLFEDGREIPIQAGDAIITPPGQGHVMWSTTDRPLTTVYVAVGLGAFSQLPSFGTEQGEHLLRDQEPAADR